MVLRRRAVGMYGRLLLLLLLLLDLNLSRQFLHLLKLFYELKANMKDVENKSHRVMVFHRFELFYVLKHI